MKKVIIGALCICCIIALGGCNDTKQNDGLENKPSEELREIERAIQEEEDALNNIPKFSVTPDEITIEFQDNNNLEYEERQSETETILFYSSKKSRYEFQYGLKGSNGLSTIYFDIFSDNPAEDEDLMGDLNSTLEQLLALLGEDFKADIIVQALTDLNSENIFEYSDTINLYSDLLSDNTVVFRIYAK